MIYFGRIKRDGRYCYVEICDGFKVSRIYDRTESGLRAELSRCGYRSVTELTANMCRGGRVSELEITSIHKLV